MANSEKYSVCSSALNFSVTVFLFCCFLFCCLQVILNKMLSFLSIWVCTDVANRAHTEVVICFAMNAFVKLAFIFEYSMKSKSNRKKKILCHGIKEQAGTKPPPVHLGYSHHYKPKDSFLTSQKGNLRIWLKCMAIIGKFFPFSLSCPFWNSGTFAYYSVLL